MASTRRARSANKRYAKINEEWFDKETPCSSKAKAKKRKLSDMLGPQWSKGELECFYESFRKHGKDWRKVANTICSRTPEMVEALYNMNQAYLSLPEGTATVAGLIAMMTDHLNILGGNNSEHESDDSPKASRKPSKRGTTKLRQTSKASNSKYPDLLQYQAASRNYGCLSILERKHSEGMRPRAVGKRTPRVPISMYNKDEKWRAGSLGEQLCDINAGDDEGTHVAALALAEVSQRGVSSQVSEIPVKDVDEMRLLSTRSSPGKLRSFPVEADGVEGSLGSNDDYSKDGLSTEDTKPSKSQRKLKRSQQKNKKGNQCADDQYDDDREACSGTEEGQSRKVKVDKAEIKEGKTAWELKSSKKRNRQLYFQDVDNSALDALHALADLSLNILQPSIDESESSAQIKEENKDIDLFEKDAVPVSPLVRNGSNTVRVKTAHREKKVSESTDADVVTTKKTKIAKGLNNTGNAYSEVKQKSCDSSIKIEKRRRSFAGKLSNSNLQNLKDDDNKIVPLERTEIEVSTEEGRVSSYKVKQANQNTVTSKQAKLLIKTPERSPSIPQIGKEFEDASETTSQPVLSTDINLHSRSRSRRKIGILKALGQKESKSYERAGETQPDKFTYPVNRISDVKKMLTHCLSSCLFRRWCMFEWFYSAIDYPWFAKNEFAEYLNHVNMGHVPQLTRIEWSVIRNSLGKPRRLSRQFLKEERQKLAEYRETVRTHYSKLRAGSQEGLPTDLSRPLSVGQRVIACHPDTRDIHNGNVLTVDYNKCRIQFDRPELGVAFVMDIDCMPLYPWENIPESLREGNIRFFPSDGLRASQFPSCHPVTALVNQAKGDTVDSKATADAVTVASQRTICNRPYTLSQMQEIGPELRAIAELSLALDKKEALLREQRNMNEEVSGKLKQGYTIRDLEHLKEPYEIVLMQLQNANDQVASALLSLRQRGTFNGASADSWLASVANPGNSVVPSDSCNSYAFGNLESGPQVAEIMETSRCKARMMVDASTQAISMLKDGEDAFEKITEALDYVGTRNAGSGSSILGIRRIPPDSVPSNSAYQESTVSNNFNQNRASHSLTSKLCAPGSDPKVQHPSDLISACVATLLMIQRCTEKQFPPAEVAHILDSAVSTLQPQCPQNIPIFREIESCMSIIKNQMLALVPTPATSNP